MDAMIQEALACKYAIAHVNVNNLEWIKAVLSTANETNSPIILAVSEGAVKYFCGLKAVYKLTKAVAEYLQIKVPVVLHLDHGCFETCCEAVDTGFTSIMYDGSHLPFATNYVRTKQLLSYIEKKKLQISVEAEIGTIGGEEDGVFGFGELANIQQCVEFAQLPITVLAAGIGNVHGVYPHNWQGLNFTLLKKIHKITKKGIVLHGGSGIPDDQIQKAINLGVCKINVNTEVQLVFQEKLRKYIEAGYDLNHNKKGYHPHKIFNYCYQAMKDKIREKLILFKSYNTVK